MNYINVKNLMNSFENFKNNPPFDHCIVDDFFVPGVAEELESDFIDYNNSAWFYYKNDIEDKKALNNWNFFPKITYNVFCELMSSEFLEVLENRIGSKMYVDHGLHGGGWHIHASGGNLNPHLDYSIHPKMAKLRKLNIIIYVSSNLEEEHGGHLGLYTHNEEKKNPGKLIKEIQPKFNRAIIFDTTQNSWHGMSRPLIQPNGIFRKSLAIYYLTDPNGGVDSRERALFAPRDDQMGNQEIQELIRIRSDTQAYYKAYRG